MNKIYKIRHKDSKLYYNSSRTGKKWVADAGSVYYNMTGVNASCQGILRVGSEILSGIGPEGESIGPFDIEIVEFIITEGVSHVFGNFKKKKKYQNSNRPIQ